MVLVSSEDFQLFRDQLDHISNQHKGKEKLPSVHVLGNFNFKDIDWPDRLNKSGSALSRSEGQMLIVLDFLCSLWKVYSSSGRITVPVENVGKRW